MEDVKSKIEQLVDEIIKDSDKFLVDVQAPPNKKVRIFVDADTSVNISDCKSISRQLYKALVENEIYEDGDFQLEVSSPGLDFPLQSMRQYKKNVGRILEVKTEDESVTEGRLKEVSEEELKLEIKQKKETKIVTIPMDQVSQSIIQPEFK